MVIAAGSYPAGRWFESDRRYQTKHGVMPLHIRIPFLNGRAPRPLGQAVKTPPFHGGNMGSIPVGVTKKMRALLSALIFLSEGNRIWRKLR